MPASHHSSTQPFPFRLRTRSGYALIPELEQLSYLTSTPMESLAQACAIPLEQSPWRFDRLTVLHTPEIRIMAARFGVGEEAIRGMTAEYFTPLLSSRSRTTRDSETAQREVFNALNPFPPQLKLCPACLHEGRNVRLAWQTTWTFMCLRHGLMLIDTCPHCQCGLASKRVSAPGVAQLGTCQNQIDGEECPQQFADLPRVHLESMPEARTAQIAFERALTGRISPLLGRPQIAQRYLRGITSLFELLWIILIPKHFTPREPCIDQAFADYCSSRDTLLALDDKEPDANSRHQTRSPLMALTSPLALQLASSSSQHATSDGLIHLIQRTLFWQPESSIWIARQLLRLRDRPDVYWHQAFNQTLHWLFKHDPAAREETQYAFPDHH